MKKAIIDKLTENPDIKLAIVYAWWWMKWAFMLWVIFAIKDLWIKKLDYAIWFLQVFEICYI